jgi:reactive intermediate/imine deaminase
MKIILNTAMRFLRNSILIFFVTSTIAWAMNNKDIAPQEPTDSPAIKIGNLIFISGQGAGSIKTPDSTGAAIEEAFQKIRVIANQMGGTLDDIVKLTVYMADLPNDYPLLNNVVPKYFKKPYPARSTVGIANLPKDHRIEIDAIMILKNSSVNDKT